MATTIVPALLKALDHLTQWLVPTAAPPSNGFEAMFEPVDTQMADASNDSLLALLPEENLDGIQLGDALVAEAEAEAEVNAEANANANPGGAANASFFLDDLMGESAGFPGSSDLPPDFLANAIADVLAPPPPIVLEIQEGWTLDGMARLASVNGWGTGIVQFYIADRLYGINPFCTSDCCLCVVSEGSPCYASGTCDRLSHRSNVFTFMCLSQGQRMNDVVRGVFLCYRGASKDAKTHRDSPDSLKPFARTAKTLFEGSQCLFIHYLFIAPLLALFALGVNSRRFDEVCLHSHTKNKAHILVAKWTACTAFANINALYASSAAAEFYRMFPESQGVVPRPNAALFRIIHVLQTCATQLDEHTQQVNRNDNITCYMPYQSSNVAKEEIRAALKTIADDASSALQHMAGLLTLPA